MTPTAAVLSPLLVRVVLLTFTGLVALALVRSATRALPREQRLRTPRRPAPVEPEVLTKLRRQLVAAQTSAGEIHYRLRPQLREIAAALLARKRRVDLDGDPDEARRLLGEETWQLLRADREPPADRRAGGLSLDELRDLVDALERQR
jgi:hypothetical protein